MCFPYSHSFILRKVSTDNSPGFLKFAYNSPLSITAASVFLPGVVIDSYPSTVSFILVDYLRHCCPVTALVHRYISYQHWCLYWRHDSVPLCHKDKELTNSHRASQARLLTKDGVIVGNVGEPGGAVR